MPNPNISSNVEIRIIKNILVSSMEAEMGSQLINFHNGEYLQTIFIVMVHPQPSTTVAAYRSEAYVVMNRTSK